MEAAVTKGSESCVLDPAGDSRFQKVLLGTQDPRAKVKGLDQEAKEGYYGPREPHE